MAVQNQAPQGAVNTVAERSARWQAPANALADAAAMMGLAQSPARRYRTRDLVGLLLAHGSRALRASQPRASVRLKVAGRNGTKAVHLTLIQP